MKKVALLFIVLLLIGNIAFAETRTFQTERVIWVMNDGSIEKSEKATKTRTFEIKKGYVYDSGVKTNGEYFGTDTPFQIYATNQEAVLSDKLFGIIERPFSNAKTESVVSAITVHSGMRPLAETLILGDSFYMLSRPSVAYNGYIIETGRKIWLID